MQDRIEKTVELKAPVGRVWRALTDHEEFGQWFRAKLDGPFKVGEMSRGRITYPVTSTTSGQRWCRPWSPKACSRSPGAPIRMIPPWTTTPRLTRWWSSSWRRYPKARACTSESGFSALPDDARRVDALRMNTQGWN